MRLVFAGTPQIAVPALQKLLASTHDVVAVVTRPDAPSGRGRTLVPSPVRVIAAEHGVEVLTPVTAGDPEFLARLRELEPDCCPVAAYGALLPQKALNIPRLGWINLHFSVLPHWRGAAPVQHAIWHGDRETGVSIFQIVKELDAGPIYAQLVETMGSRDTAGDVLDRLAISGAELLVSTMDALARRQTQAHPQPESAASYAPKITADDAHVRWMDPTFAIDRQIRACTPTPGAWTIFRGERLKLGPVQPIDNMVSVASVPVVGEPRFSRSAEPSTSVLRPGELVVQKKRVLVGTATGVVELGKVKAPGKTVVAAADWARGARPRAGEAFE